MEKQIRLSPSSLSIFLDCPRCFWRHMNLGIRRPSGIFPSLPGGMDRVLKDHFDRHRAEGTYPEELEGKFKGRLFDDMERLRVWRNNFRGLRYIDKKSGAMLMGALDDLFVTSDGKYAPLDFKTRGAPRKTDTHEHYQNQMDIYSFLLQENGMKPAEFAILIFYHPVNVNEEHNVEFDPDPIRIPVNRERGKRIFLEAVKCLKGPEPEPGRFCEYCAWLKKVK